MLVPRKDSDKEDKEEISPTSAVERRETRERRFSHDIDSPDMREAMLCGYCGNSLTMSKKANEVEIKGKKAPKVESGEHKGEYLMKSPGATEGKLNGMLCDTCWEDREAGRPRDPKSAVVILQDGTVKNMPLAELS